jgi:hypothetical protein
MANSWNDISLTTLYTPAIAYDAAAATIEGLLEVIYGVGEVTVADDTDYTITFSMDTGDSELVADFALLTGSTDPLLTITQEYMINPLDGTNSGTKPCDCVVTCDMTADSTGGLKITLVETSEYLDLDRSLSNGDEVIFNTETRMVTVNSSDARPDIDFDSTWFKLPVGAFTINADPVDVQIQATFRQRWI